MKQPQFFSPLCNPDVCTNYELQKYKQPQFFSPLCNQMCVLKLIHFTESKFTSLTVEVVLEMHPL